MKIDFDYLEKLAGAGATANVIIEVLRAAEVRGQPKRARERDRQRARRSQPKATNGNIGQHTTTPSQVAEKEIYALGRKHFGKNAGGLISSLIRHHNYDLPAARGVVDFAMTKQDPREYLAATMRTSNGKQASRSLAAAGDDLIARAEELERTFDLGPTDYARTGGEGGEGAHGPIPEPARR